MERRCTLVYLGVLAAVCLSQLSTALPVTQRGPSTSDQTQRTCGVESCPPLDPNKLNVHMVPHSHDDVGWLKTVDQYYYGVSTRIQRAGVQYIIDSVVASLLEDPSRRFVYVETAFLWKWWNEQDEVARAKVRGLINSGQLEIIGGAWSMNDEAVTHYQSIVDQFTWGLRILNDTFGECARPQIGWQIDPFGHSREMASLFAQMGYNGLFFGRLDYQDKAKRLRDRTAEMIWHGSPDNLGAAGDLFTHALYNQYSPPRGFCFDVLCQDEPMVDNKRSPEYNIPERVANFIDAVKTQAESYATNNIILTMGEDFNYQVANMWFRNMDKLITHVNAEQVNGSQVNLFYSTPGCYLKAVHDAAMEWPTKDDDFFPYGSDYQTYWTGYYTSKPTVKYFERLGNNFLQVGKQIAALARTSEDVNVGVTALREAMGVMQHHDAITGTMKDHVAQDYSRLLYNAFEQCGNTVQTALSEIMSKDGKDGVPLVSCLRLNISDCALSESSERFVVTVWNPLSRPVSHYVRLPAVGLSYTVRDASGSVVPSDRFAIHPSVLNVPGRQSAAQNELLFQASQLPPLGYRSYHVSQTALSGEPSVKDTQQAADTIGNEHVTLELDEVGQMKSIKINGVDIRVQQSFRFYTGSTSGRASGAYIFRPEDNSTTEIPISKFIVRRGMHAVEVHQWFGDWVSQVIRIYKDDNHVEFEWMVGPIPDGDGTEVISLFQTDLQTDGTFYTDSNGRELLKRVRNFRPTWPINVSEPISSNYYPVTSKILIRDESKQQEVAVLVDRAQGGSSMEDGQMELMLHRRLYYDDGFGVDEALNEHAYGTGLVARGKHYLTAGPLSGISPSLAVQERLLAQEKLLNPWTFLSPTELSHSEWSSQYNMEYHGIREDSLPTHVQVLTLEPWKENSILLRLENILEKSDDEQLATTATVNLQELFSMKIDNVKETTLAGNQWLAESERLRWKTKSGNVENTTPQQKLDITAVTLDPMQIRTFVVTIATKEV